MKLTHIENEKVLLTLTNKNISDITEYTFADDVDISKAVSKTLTSATFELTLSELEDLQGNIAASANHSDNAAVEKRLDTLFFKIDAALNQRRCR